MRKTKTSYTKSRYRELLWLFVQKHQPLCFLCNKSFELETDLPARAVDQLTEHHKDGNHSNSELSNRVLVHRHCHKKHHTADNIHGADRKFWRQFK